MHVQCWLNPSTNSREVRLTTWTISRLNQPIPRDMTRGVSSFGVLFRQNYDKFAWHENPQKSRLVSQLVGVFFFFFFLFLLFFFFFSSSSSCSYYFFFLSWQSMLQRWLSYPEHEVHQSEKHSQHWIFDKHHTPSRQPGVGLPCIVRL